MTYPKNTCRTEYTFLGAVTEFKFSHEICATFRGFNQLKWMKSWGPAWNMLPSKDAFVFVDNHDNQRQTDNSNILTYKSRQQYIMAVAFMLSHTYGTPRVMSSFEFNTFDQGISYSSPSKLYFLISLFLSYPTHNSLIQSFPLIVPLCWMTIIINFHWHHHKNKIKFNFLM